MAAGAVTGRRLPSRCQCLVISPTCATSGSGRHPCPVDKCLDFPKGRLDALSCAQIRVTAPNSRRLNASALALRAPERRRGVRRRLLLGKWFRSRRRTFTWRHPGSPWEVFLAEMLLRRTRADQVARHLPNILERFPDASTMAAADLTVVQAILRPLGLNWRARTLHESAQSLVDRHRGEVPVDVSFLMELPGVGPYVAAATVAALSRKKVVLVDTNTVRVARRTIGLTLTGDIRRRQIVTTAVVELLGGPASATAWWSVLDLAAKVCLPGKPICKECPISGYCKTGRDATHRKDLGVSF
jgi:A/G-specific adenine glycosylase